MNRLRSLVIDRTMLVPKTIYFFFFAAMAALAPFLALYYEQIGLSGRQIGLLAGILPLTTLIGAPLFGGLADATQQHDRLLRLAIAGILIAGITFSWTTSFFWLIPLVITYAFFFAPILPLIDNAVLDLLDNREDQYGKQRLWGAVGWGIAGPTVGLLAEHVDLRWAFYSFFVLMSIVLMATFRLPISKVSIRNQFWRGLRLLLTNWQWPFFLIAAFAGGVGLSVNLNYLFLYLNELGASTSLMGLSLTVGTISEVLVMFRSDQLLGRWGARSLFLIALLILSGRIFAYSAVQSPWLIVLIQLLHGPSFAAIWVAGVAYADQLAPEGLGATAQGLFAGAMWGLGAAFGAFSGGLLYEEIGFAPMFQWVAAIIFLGVIFFALTGNSGVKLKSMFIR